MTREEAKKYFVKRVSVVIDGMDKFPTIPLMAYEMAIEALSEPIGIICTESLSIDGEQMMPESCMDCKLNGSCKFLPRWAEQEQLNKLYFERLDNCPLWLAERKEP